jgi:hypothetical protein
MMMVFVSKKKNDDGDLVTSPGHGMWAHASVNAAPHSTAQRQPLLNVFFQALSYPTASSASVLRITVQSDRVHRSIQLAGLQRPHSAIAHGLSAASKEMGSFA